MTEVRRIRNREPFRWTSGLGLFVLFGGLGFMGVGFSFSGPLPGVVFQALIGLAWGMLGYGLVMGSQWLLDGPQLWAFDDDGYRHSRQSKLWPVVRRVAYADIARIQVTRLPDQANTYALTLILRSSKTVQINANWTETELSEIRNLLATRMPGSTLPLPA